MTQEQLQLCDLEDLPFGIAVPLREALRECRYNPPIAASKEAYILIGREDIAFQMEGDVRTTPLSLTVQSPSHKHHLVEKDASLDGTELDNEITFLRFSKDLRLQEVRKLLTSGVPVVITNSLASGQSDHDLVLAQQTRLALLCKRTMSIPVGRGMFTLSSISEPLLTEAIYIPPLISLTPILTKAYSVHIERKSFW
jgi:anaphase-promoting complex subunit 1